MIDILTDLPAKPPSIYVDIEGVRLLRKGSISILQLYVLPNDHTYLVDVHQLQDIAFITTGKKLHKCPKAILKSEDITKVFFDLRNDSDALFYHIQISLARVDDIRLMELATRVNFDASMTTAEKRIWAAKKENGLKMFLPEKGGQYEVFNDRPLADEIIRYCVQDVRFLPRPWSLYRERISIPWTSKVRTAEGRMSLS
ncbi:hypothetical protein BU23DRAFT_583015 [Bimuria novae-zelandiae CBS 107.79]|uniref:3'-5' exonuclease domain-containing protein n=1 Tax=Bimuria novae-zelandiae CBS 107.79 TaxID=1447943 RepID=A0A6A5UY97_9PLEO|nr:hypothetical protein BU23DRAFT_583015 [Bimuria novae-zelandiae CBS 107.79]